MTPREIIQGLFESLTDMEDGRPVVSYELLQAARDYLASPDAPPALPEPELGEGGAPGRVTGGGDPSAVAGGGDDWTDAEGLITVRKALLRLALEADRPHPTSGSLGWYECRWPGCGYRREYPSNTCDNRDGITRPHGEGCPLEDVP